MTQRKMLAWVTVSLLLLFVSSCAIEQPKIEATFASTRRALLRGEIKEALASHEAQAQEAEKNALASLFPQQYWEAAAWAYIEASRAARFSGYLQKAIAYAEKAMDIGEKINEPVFKLRAINQLIWAHRYVRNFDKGQELIQKGFGIVKEIPAYTSPRFYWEGLLYSRLGLDLMRRREYVKAIDAFSQSVYLHETYLAALSRPKVDPTVVENTRVDLVDQLRFLGSAYHRAGRLQEASEQYQRAFNSIKEWRLKYHNEGSLYSNMADIYVRQDDFPQALENSKKALALAESQGRPAAVRLASGRVGDIFRQTGKSADAVPYFQKAIQQIESTRSFLESEEYRQSYFEGELDAYASMIGVLLESGKWDEAFNYSERARSRVFLDVLGSKVQLSRVKSGLLEEERALNERIAAIKARLAGEEEGETERAGLRRALAEAEKAYSAFLAKVRKGDKEQASLMSVEPLTLKQVQELLDPGTTLIEYFVTQPNIFVWVVEKDRVHYQRVELPRGKLSDLVKTLRETIFTLGEREKFNEVSTALYQHLLQGVLPHVRGKELIVVPHDVLHYLPFHALLSPDGRYLIEKYPIYYLSSASLLQFTKEKRRAKGDKVLAFGNPDLGDPSKNLRFAELEAQEVQSLYPQSTVLLRKEATEEKGKALSPQHDILHFATHAELKEDDPLSSAILLTKDGKEDGRLEVREIFGMDLNANLVVLSACETGLGKLSSGDEFVGLTRAFIYAGTPSVMASLWKVEDSSTAALMASFYRNLRTMSKVEALRQAQLQLIRGEAGTDLLAQRGVGGVGKLGEVPGAKPRSPTPVPDSVSTSHPYFWAPFILVGDGK